MLLAMNNYFCNSLKIHSQPEVKSEFYKYCYPNGEYNN
jgi:hypothetical protein